MAFQQHAALAVRTGGVQAGDDAAVLAFDFHALGDGQAAVGEDHVAAHWA